MSAASNYLEQQIINTYFRGQATFVALCTANPTDAGGNEVSTAAFPAYVRQAADASGSTGSGWTNPGSTAGVTTNSNKMTFPAFDGASEVTITHFAVYDASTSGNMLVYTQLAESRTLRSGDRLIFDTGSLSVTIA